MGVATPVANEAKPNSAAALMAKGPEALHDLMLADIQGATGRPMPRMDVRFNNLSVTADIVVVEDDGSKQELPTLPNTVKKAFAGPKKRSVRKEILKNVSGVFKPGTITLLLGQPGSGKSALLKMLSARFPEAKNVTVEGDISFNNVPRQQIKDRLPQFVSYTDQRDKHFAPLTVKETLEFAYQVCGGDITKRKEFVASLPSEKENLEALQATKAIFQHYPDVIIQQLGLQNCQDTIVGDAMIRGVSGGERKRVTTGEMEFGMKFVSLMDEISTGLDSAATFDIIKTQRSIAHKLNKTVVIALLQPSPEIFALFDNVMILNEGELMYHGPCNKVEGYFESLGFKCPPERDIADYLLDLGTRQQYRYEIEQGSKAPRLPQEFGDSFRQSALYQETLDALTAPHEPELLKTVKDSMDPMPKFQQSFLESTATLFKREIMITYRNKAFIFGRLLMILVMGLLFSTIYYDFDPTQVSVATGVIFSSVMFLSMGQSSQLPVFMANRDIFYKQRGANFYRTSSYVLANSIGGIPLSLAETVIFGTLVYWLCGFAAEAGLFILFELILLLSNLAMGSWFFFLSSVCSHENIATPLCMMSILIFIIFAGFIVTTDEIPDYLIWAHWISPMSWSIKALAINQYRSSAFDVCVYGAIDYCTDYGFTMGEYYLDLFGLDTGKEWVAYGVIYLATIYVVFMFLSYLALEHLRYEAPTNVDVSEKSAGDDSYALLETPKASSTHSDVVEVQVNTQEKNFVPVTVAFQDLHYWVP
ncbi:ABC transporter, partial [Phytophthora megakarya]